MSTSYDWYREFILKTKIDRTMNAKVSSTSGSNLGPIGVVISFLLLGACEFEHKFIMSKHLLCTVILGLDFFKILEQQ